MSNERRKSSENEVGFTLVGYGKNAEYSPPAGNDNLDWESIGNLAANVLLHVRIKGAPDRAGRIYPELLAGREEEASKLGKGVGRTIIGVTKVTMSKQTCDPHGKDCLMEERTASEGDMLPRDG